jgi:glutathione S-transferase
VARHAARDDARGARSRRWLPRRRTPTLSALRIGGDALRSGLRDRLRLAVRSSARTPRAARPARRRTRGTALAREGRVRFVELEEARAARGLRVVVATGVPSPWSQAALGTFDIKGLDYVAVRFRRRDGDIKLWTGASNAPVVLYDDEPPRTGWAEILALGERLGGRVSLVPDDDETRARMFGLSHEILGEGGLGWSVRLLLTHLGLTTDGREGWPRPVADHLAPRYGYAPERVDAARARALRVLRLLERVLAESRARGDAYLLGGAPTALDVHCAVGLAPIDPMPEDACPMLPAVRHAFETLDADVRAAVSPALRAHRALMFERHLVLPVRS